MSPSSVALSQGDFLANTTVAIGNRSDTPVYSVWVKLTLTGVTSESVVIKPPVKSTTLEGAVGDIFVSGDNYLINGTDESGHEAVYIYLQSIPPVTTREFIVSGSTTFASHAAVSVVSFKEAPEPMLQSPDRVVLFHVPEKMTIKKISVLINKVREPPQQ